jgi:hypothetical protein
MNRHQLGKRLRTELARNKGKSAVLGIVCVVALYFWLPLIWGLFRKKEASPAAAVEATPAVAPVTEGLPEAAAFHWREFLSWRDKDPRMMVVAMAAGTRNPFERPPAELASDVSPAELQMAEPEPVERQRHPLELGLELRGTVVGRANAVADIAGKIYVPGAIIRPLAGDEDAGDALSHIAFRLVEIDRTHVVLERDGKLFRLDLPAAGGPESDSIMIRRLGE